ncbi:MAG: hypothetical protein ACRDSS_09815 [Actinocrinis sp.]
MFAAPGYNGCPFQSASAEAEPGSLVAKAHADYRAWVRALFKDLALDADVPESTAHEIARSFICSTTRRPCQRKPTQTRQPRIRPEPPPSQSSTTHATADAPGTVTVARRGGDMTATAD